jgi:hypothetical protein
MVLSAKMEQHAKQQPMGTLFDFDIPKNTDPPEDVEITTSILYFSKSELREFKKLAKEAIKRRWQQDYQQRGNLSDLILALLREDAENNK